jgi:shikimate kinase
LPGSGKSAVAPLLAAQLGRGYLDIDAEVESRLGMSVGRVFSDLGEARFRAEERRTAEQALASPAPLVIAAGGGLIAQHGAIDLLERHATVVCLDASDSELTARLGADGRERPLLAASPAEAVRHLRASRTAAHGRSHMHVRTDQRTPAEVPRRCAVRCEWPPVIPIWCEWVPVCSRPSPSRSRRRRSGWC